MVSYLIAVVVLIVIAYVPARALLHDPKSKPSILEGAIYLTIGWATLAVLGTILTAVRLSPEIAAVPLLLISVTSLFKYRFDIVTLTVPKQISSVWLIGGLAISMPLIAAVIMGLGNYPAYFFSVEAPVYLSYAHALAQFNQYPPPDLTHFDLDVVGASYHFGTSAMAAILSRLSGLAMHQAMFHFLTPVLLIGTICAAGKVVLDLVRPGYAPYALCLLIILFPLIIEPELVTRTFSDPRWALSRYANPETFRHGFPTLSTQYGVMMALAIFSFIANPSDRYRERLFVLIVGTLIFFKSPHFVGLGAGIAGWSIYRLSLFREYRPLVVSLIALATSICLQQILTPPDVNLIFYLGFSIKRIFSGNAGILLGIMPLCVPAILLFYWQRSNQLGLKVLNYSWFFIGPLILTNLLAIERLNDFDGTIKLASDLLQTLKHAPLAVSVITVFLLGASWAALTTTRKRIIGCLIVALSIPPILHQTGNVWQILTNPSRGHEQADNRAIAPALQAIVPIKGSLSVTNDFTYRLSHQTRPNWQYQIAAIFGHAWYGVVFGHVQISNPSSRLRYTSQQQLMQEEWHSGILEDAEKYGWSHMLLNKNQPYPKQIPAEPVFENKDYVVYSFSTIRKQI